MMTERENYLRAMSFDSPQWIPCGVYLSPVSWNVYGKELQRIVNAYSRLFSHYKNTNTNFHEYEPSYREGEYYKDNWGCVWYNVQGGIRGLVVEHPLADWSAFSEYQPPDPEFKAEFSDRNWVQTRKDIRERKANGLLTVGNAERLFDRLFFLRGFENLMMDLATDDPHLLKLIGMLLDYETKLVNKWLEMGVDVILFHTDIGTQDSLMISPAKFRQYIKPMFKQLFVQCRQSGSKVVLSSDGHLLEIVDDLLECGVSMHDPQVRANTIDGIAKTYKGKLCINLDLDRQMFPFCSPQDINEQVGEAVEKLNDPRGGLMISASIFGADVPMKNIEAICQSLEKFCLRC